VNVLSRRIGSVVAAAAVAVGLAAVAAPAASAAPTVTAPAHVTAAAARPTWWCKPAHVGRDWRWHEGRRGGHWDHREWNRRTHRLEWNHQWRDDRYGAARRFDGPPNRSDGPPARGPERGRN
jgi:hypothetical protein